ncbi:DUF3810 domain-containing protein [Robiginitalea marina]|uniref:DUF3810 domain-containing protein n=1 Tax=Robiginitalea marina TaxID=2954105 RepID=A0ABT1AZQ6_9FLAO|nr:DUF3810 domain-containing protein [Robiginitalea marina]MCO5725462.1 DUF3810 domain-containing protein [Robiginitalea marina]
MAHPLKNGLALSLPLQVVLIAWVSGHPQWVESAYSQGLYPHISTFFRYLYGWVPFSVGDLCYFLLGIAGLAWVIRKWHWIRNHPWSFFRDVAAGVAVLYFSFYLLWGLNYFRMPLSHVLGLRESYTTSELVSLTARLGRETNLLQSRLCGDTLQPVRLPYSKREILEKTLEAYGGLAEAYPPFRYTPPSLKPSLFSTLLSYMGYGGYLNPFTGEAQVNRRLPLFRYPVVCGHEVGHQLGYSAENETNFIGYLVTLHSPDPYFRYSALTFGLSHCLSEVNRRDPEAYKKLLGEIHPGVRGNFRELQEFWKAFENPMEPVFKAIFNQYLEANRQKDGIRSYNRVVSLMVAYHRENPGM